MEIIVVDIWLRIGGAIYLLPQYVFMALAATTLRMGKRIALILLT
jgi:hypothetical protein